MISWYCVQYRYGSEQRAGLIQSGGVQG